MNSTLTLLYLLVVAAFIVMLVLALVVIVGDPTNSLKLLAWSDVAGSGGLVALVMARTRP